MSRGNKVWPEKAEDMRTQYRNAANALAKAQAGLLESRDALDILGKHYSSQSLVGFISYVSETRFLLQEAYAAEVGELAAARLFEIPARAVS